MPRTRESVVPNGPRDVGESDDAFDGLFEGGPRGGKVHALRLQGHGVQEAGANCGYWVYCYEIVGTLLRSFAVRIEVA